MIMRTFASVCLVACSLTGLTNCLGQEGVKDLFNGKDLSGWKGNSQLWSVHDGAITGRTTADNPLKFNTFLIWEGEVADFELDLDYKIVGGNSGIQYRSKLLNPDDFVVGGYQADIDASLTYTGINYEEKGRGILAKRGKRATINAEGKTTEEEFAKDEDLKKVIKLEEWNHYRVIAKGNKLSHSINGTLMSETIDNQESKAAKKGILALQIHVGPPMVVQFKNVRLKQ